ncbi:MAG: hypothetical protein Q7J84_10520 [Sulfuricaulis sp.]|nr:hypothetical protein [Sulfuricaulis sp.]
MTAQFQVLGASNTARVTLSDPRPNNWHSREVCTGADVRSIAHAILCYARERDIPFAAVETSIIYPEGQS